MEARTFIGKKHDAAVDELKAIEAEYIPRRDAAQAMIDMTQKWLDELGGEKGAAEEAPKGSAQNWASSRA